jgi:membrane-bound lytic murein transglycosylase B
MRRRAVVAGAALAGIAAAARPAWAQQGSFQAFLDSVAAQARRAGISDATIQRALSHLQPNMKVIELDHRQPEFTFTWQQYRDRVVNHDRVLRGRALYAQHGALLREVGAHYGVSPGIIMGIWGLESDYGRQMGGFNVIDALATLAWEGRRAAFFRSELMDALRILDAGDIGFSQMIGSYAGAMGQTQFMPDSFLRYAVDWSGTGRRDIWGDLGCVFASTANYLAREGWRPELPWGERVQAGSLQPQMVGRDHRMAVAEWIRLGVRRDDGSPPGHPQASAAILMPGGEDDQAYLVYFPNFRAVRSYNPADFYDICVGLIGDLVVA